MPAPPYVVKSASLAPCTSSLADPIMYGFQYLRIWAVHRARTQQHLNTGDNERRTKVLSWHTSENACCRNPNSLLMNSFPSIVSTSHSSLTLKLSR